MLKFIHSITALLFPFLLFSQSYIGFEADNFNGVHGVISNPANIADSRTKIDINLASISAFTTNTYLEIDYTDVLIDDENLLESSNFLGRDDINYGILNIDVLGPSALITLDEKQSIAITSRLRSITNVNNISGEVIEFFETEDLLDVEQITETNINGSVINNNWLELGASYARVLNDNKVHFLKGGLSIKYIIGNGSAVAEIDDGLIAFDPITSGGDVLTLGSARYNFSENFDLSENFIPFENDDDFDIISETRGLGFDIGFVYEYRPQHRQNVSRDHVQKQKKIRHKNTYKYKVGLSILDIGSLTYKESLELNGSLNARTDLNTLLRGNFENEIKTAFNPDEIRVEQKILLPTTLRANFDLKLKENFYLNANSILSLHSKNSTNANRLANQFTISPRYETKWFTAFSPISITQFSGVQWGLGARLGPVFLGSSGAISHFLIDNKTRAIDIYAGIKIPIFHKTPPLPKEEDPTSGYESNCNGCLEKDKKERTKRIQSYRGGLK